MTGICYHEHCSGITLHCYWSVGRSRRLADVVVTLLCTLNAPLCRRRRRAVSTGAVTGRQRPRHACCAACCEWQVSKRRLGAWLRGGKMKEEMAGDGRLQEGAV